jgi:threonine dehydratase
VAVSLDDIRAAAGRIAGAVEQTPLVHSRTLSQLAGAQVFLKFENLQFTASFKERGALNKLLSLSAAERARGVIAMSAGNHAQAVAYHAARLGIPATIVMPKGSPNTKIKNTQVHGAAVVLEGENLFEAGKHARALAARDDLVFVHPYEDERIIAGQGTVGLEIAEQARLAGADLEAVLIPCSGGGLSSGTALAVRDAMPGARIFTVEPQGFDDFARSLQSGKREHNDPGARSICDALMVTQPGEITFALGRETLAGGLAVSDDEARAAVAFAFNELKLVVEPGGAVALAALLSGRYKSAGGPVAIVLSGGNIDPGMLADCLARSAG